MHKRLIARGAFLILLAAAWTAVFRIYSSENENKRQPFSMAGKAPQSVAVGCTMLNFDPQRGDLLVRMEFRPQGDLQDNLVLRRDIGVYTNASSGRLKTVFKKGEIMSPFEVAISVNGEVGDYPFDHYDGIMQLMVGTPKENGEIDPIPMWVEFDTTVAGFIIYPEEVPTPADDPHNNLFLRLDLRRTTSVHVFATFIMVLMWLVMIASALVVNEVYSDDRLRLPDLPLFQWLATLLFAMLPLRNAMPYVPAFGARCDYLSFFWAVSGIAISMLVLVIIWLRRRRLT